MHLAPKLEDRRAWNERRPGVAVRQSITGVASHCSTVAFPAITAWGALYGDDVTHVKSGLPGDRTIEDRHPAGSNGGTAASNVSS